MKNGLKIVVLSMIFCASMQSRQRLSPTNALVAAGRYVQGYAEGLNAQILLVSTGDVTPFVVGGMAVSLGLFVGRELVKKPIRTTLAIAAVVAMERYLRSSH